MEGATRENGLKIIWKEWASIFGMMEEFTKVNIKMTRSTASEFTLGLMADATRGTGIVVSNTVSVLISCPRMKSRNLGSGKMASVLSGSIRSRFERSTSINWTTLSISTKMSQRR